MELLKDLYYNPKIGFIGPEKLYQKAKPLNPNITMKDVQNFLNAQEVYQLTQQPKPPKEYSSITAPYIRYNYQIDLMVYDRYTFHNYKYILVVIDVYSRYVQARPLTTRQFPVIMKNLEEIFSDMGIPENINCDLEFNTHQFEDYCKKHKITVWFSDPNEINKNAIVERFNRTLANMIQKWRISTKHYDWYSVLPDLIDNYNNTIHGTTKNTPAAIWNEKAVNEQEYNFVESKFNIGDKVRIKIEKSIFSKGDAISYSKEVYTIIKKIGNRFQLSGLTKLFKDYELKQAGSVNYIEEPEVVQQEEEHKQIQEERKLTRLMNKEGIEKSEDFKEPIQLRPRKEQIKEKKIKIPKKPSAKKKPEKYIIESILGKEKRGNQIYYEVKWQGYNETTWEPRKILLQDVPELVKEFEDKH